MNRRSISNLSAIAAFGFVSTAMLGMSSGAAHAQTAKDLVGTWQLVSAVNTAADGTKFEPYGPKPVGMLIFTADGHVMNVLLRGDLPKIASNNRAQATADENKAIVEGSNAFFGTYSVREKVITVKIESGTYPNWDGTQQERNIFAFNDDELKWGVAAASGGGQGEVTYKRIR